MTGLSKSRSSPLCLPKALICFINSWYDDFLILLLLSSPASFHVLLSTFVKDFTTSSCKYIFCGILKMESLRESMFEFPISSILFKAGPCILNFKGISAEGIFADLFGSEFSLFRFEFSLRGSFSSYNPSTLNTLLRLSSLHNAFNEFPNSSQTKDGVSICTLARKILCISRVQSRYGGSLCLFVLCRMSASSRLILVLSSKYASRDLAILSKCNGLFSLLLFFFFFLGLDLRLNHFIRF